MSDLMTDAELKSRTWAIPASVLRHIDALSARVARYESALELISAPVRPDGTWNRDREACRQVARAALADGGKP